LAVLHKNQSIEDKKNIFLNPMEIRRQFKAKVMLETSTSIVDVDVPALLEDSTGPWKSEVSLKQK
jgi:hypothetical protein